MINTIDDVLEFHDITACDLSLKEGIAKGLELAEEAIESNYKGPNMIDDICPTIRELRKLASK